jgi:transposase
MMAYRYGNRYQMALLPQSIEGYVAQDNSVRAYDAFVEAIDLGELGIEFNRYRVGISEYDPKTMVKLLVYGYSYGVKSSRKLERECYHNIAFIWLMGGPKLQGWCFFCVLFFGHSKKRTFNSKS